MDKALKRLREREQQESKDKSAADGKKERLRLVDEMAKDTQDKFTLRSHIINAFSPAHDGAGITLSNAMFHLARHPAAWTNLREEILPSAHEPLTYELLNSYRYLSWVLKESNYDQHL